MTIEVGIMQGRLLPRAGGRFQAFPADGWRDEFPRARAAGLACIEWIYEEPNEGRNPLGTDDGIAEIHALAREHGVAVRSVCADYYMTRRLVAPDGQPERANQEHLDWLVGRMAKLGAAYAVLPFVDSSSLASEAERATAVGVMRAAAAAARRHRVELHVECDLQPEAFAALLDAVGEPLVKANYDIGNSASLGYAPREELGAIGRHLGSVHVKDRLRGGGTVPLGTGAADLRASFAMIRASGFSRWFILQAARGEDGDEVALAARNRALVEHLWSEAAPDGGERS